MLHGGRKRDAMTTLVYLSHSIQIYHLLQAQMGLRLETEIGHLQVVWLKEQELRTSDNNCTSVKRTTRKTNGSTTGNLQVLQYQSSLLLEHWQVCICVLVTWLSKGENRMTPTGTSSEMKEWV